jgi:uncharacterized protein with beta-barrel porin domain
MGQPFNFRQRQICVLVATFCLSAGNAYAVACPAGSGSEIRIANQTVTATCTVPNTTPTPTSIVIEATGAISVSNYPDPAIQVSVNTAIGTINNSGTVQSTGNAVQVQGTVQGNITNFGAIAGTGIAGGQTSEGIRLDSASVFGTLNNVNSASITAANGNAIHLIGTELDGGIHNFANAEISSAAGYAAILVEGGSAVHSGIVNEGHIGPSAVGPQNGRGLQIGGSTIYGNINNSGTIDARGSYMALQLDNSTVYNDESQALGTLTNSGTIDASTGLNGIELVNNSRLGSIQNTGIIQAAGSAISVTNSTLANGITNSLSIRAGQDAILASAATLGAIANTGTIASSGASAIHLTAATALSGGIHNAVAASMEGAGGSAAVRIDGGSTVTGDIFNEGRIGPTAGQPGGGLQIFGATLNGNIINAGVIDTSNGFVGVQIDSSTVTGALTNSGTIGTSDSGVQVVNGASIASINNTASGLIQAASNGISVTGGSVLTSGIVNSGTITGANALNLANTGSAFVVSNSGTLNGNVQLGINRLDILGSGTVSGNVVGGAGSIVNIGTDSAHTATSTPAGNFTGLDRFNIGVGSTLHARSGLAVGAANVTNAGLLSIASGNTASVTGNYTQSSTGVLRTGFASASSFGKLNVSGNASLAAGAVIDVDVANAAVLVIGTAASGVISAGGTLSGASTAAVTDNSYLFNFAASSADGKAMNLTAVSAAAAPAPAPAPASGPAPSPAPSPAPTAPRSVGIAVLSDGNPASAGAAAVFDSLIAGGTTGDMTSVITALGKLTTAKQVSDAVRQTLPLANGATVGAVSNTMRLIDSAVHARMVVVHTGGPDGDDSAQATDRGIWFTPVGAWTRQQGRDGVDGYRAQSGGMVLGADTAVSAGDRVGGAFSYSRASIDGRGAAAQSAHIDVYRLMAYGRHSIDDSTFVGWQGDFGTTQTSGDRSIAFGGLARRADSDYSGTVAHIGADIGRAFLIDSATQFTPSLRADYAVVRNKAYAETGAGALNLNVQAQKTEQFLLAAHATLTHDVSEGLQLSGNLGLGYDFLARRDRVVSAFAGGGPTFATEGLRAQRLVVTGGLGLTLMKAKGLELTARYDVELRRSFSNQSIGFKLAKKF